MDTLPDDMIVELCRAMGPDVLRFSGTCKRFWAIFNKIRATLEQKTIWIDFGSLMFKNNLFPDKCLILTTSISSLHMRLKSSFIKFIPGDLHPYMLRYGITLFIYDNYVGIFRKPRDYLDYSFMNKTINVIAVNGANWYPGGYGFNPNAIIKYHSSELYEKMYNIFLKGTELETTFGPGILDIAAKLKSYI